MYLKVLVAPAVQITQIRLPSAFSSLNIKSVCCEFVWAAARVFLILTLKHSDCKETIYFLLLCCSCVLALRKRLKTLVCFFSHSLSSCISI